jgi:hypothetical protein
MHPGKMEHFGIGALCPCSIANDQYLPSAAATALQSAPPAQLPSQKQTWWQPCPCPCCAGQPFLALAQTPAPRRTRAGASRSHWQSTWTPSAVPAGQTKHTRCIAYNAAAVLCESSLLRAAPQRQHHMRHMMDICSCNRLRMTGNHNVAPMRHTPTERVTSWRWVFRQLLKQSHLLCLLRSQLLIRNKDVKGSELAGINHHLQATNAGQATLRTTSQRTLQHSMVIGSLTT